MSKKEHSTSYRVSKVFIRYGCAIDQVKFQYTDGTHWSYGINKGTPCVRPLTLIEGEYITEVIMDALEQEWYAGASAEFRTSRGRSYKFYPEWCQTQDKSQVKHFKAPEGKEILSLKIRKGTLVDIYTQDLPKDQPIFNKNDDWLRIFWIEHPKQENSQLNTLESHNHHHHSLKINEKEFKNLQEALKFQKQNSNKNFSLTQILFDVKNNKIIKQQGDLDNLEYITKYAIEQGYYLDSVFIQTNDGQISNIIKFFKNCNVTKADIPYLILVMILIILSNFLSGYQQMTFGKILNGMAQKNEDTINEIKEMNIIKLIQYFFIYLKFDYLENLDLTNNKLIIVMALFTIGLTTTIIKGLQTFLQEFLRQKKTYQMKIQLFEKALHMETGFFDTHTVFDIKRTIDPKITVDNQCIYLPEFTTSIIKMVTYILMMVYISWELGLCFIVMFPIYIFTIQEKVAKKVSFLDLLHLRSGLQGYISLRESFDHIQLVKNFSQEKNHIEVLKQAQKEQMKLGLKATLYKTIYNFFVDFIQVFLFCFCLIFGIQKITQGNLSAGDLTGFFMLLTQIIGITSSLQGIYWKLKEHLMDIEKTKMFIKSQSKRIEGNLILDEKQHQINFNNISFYYPARPHEWVLQDISFTIQPGKMVALVGESGSGKSTISSLLMRLYDPIEGGITIDGTPINEYSLSSLHKNITIVTQTPQLFNNTIRYNLTYGINREVSEDEIIEATKKANAYDFIMTFRSGFDTLVGSQSSSQLSGGQKQRIVIARAYLMKPQILILDEATSALDSENEKFVQEAIDQIMKDRTVLVIAHRLSTIKKSDLILCLKNGKVVERGNHKSLLEQNGYYKVLVEKQKLGTEE